LYIPPVFSSSKSSLFHNSKVFGSCIIHILYTGCAKIKKKSKLSGTSNFHEHDFSYTAEPNRADMAHLAKRRVNRTDDFDVIKLFQTLIFFYIISLAQHTVIPRRVFPDLRLFIFRRLEPERFAENGGKKRARKIEQYNILLQCKWRIQALLRINRENVSTKRNVCSVRKPLTDKTLSKFLTVCHVVQNALYKISVTHISVLSLLAYQNCMPTEHVQFCVLRVFTLTEQVPWFTFSRTMALWAWKLTLWVPCSLHLAIHATKHGPNYNINPLTHNDPYRGRTAPLTSKRSILYIYSTNIGTEYFKHGTQSLFFFFSSKYSLFHNSNVFGSCIIHILYTGGAKI